MVVLCIYDFISIIQFIIIPINLSKVKKKNIRKRKEKKNVTSLSKVHLRENCNGYGNFKKKKKYSRGRGCEFDE